VVPGKPSDVYAATAAHVLNYLPVAVFSTPGRVRTRPAPLRRSLTHSHHTHLPDTRRMSEPNTYDEHDFTQAQDHCNDIDSHVNCPVWIPDFDAPPPILEASSAHAEVKADHHHLTTALNASAESEEHARETKKNPAENPSPIYAQHNDMLNPDLLWKFVERSNVGSAGRCQGVLQYARKHPASAKRVALVANRVSTFDKKPWRGEVHSKRGQRCWCPAGPNGLCASCMSIKTTRNYRKRGTSSIDTTPSAHYDSISPLQSYVQLPLDPDIPTSRDIARPPHEHDHLLDSLNLAALIGHDTLYLSTSKLHGALDFNRTDD